MLDGCQEILLGLAFIAQHVGQLVERGSLVHGGSHALGNRAHTHRAAFGIVKLNSLHISLHLGEVVFAAEIGATMVERGILQRSDPILIGYASETAARLTQRLGHGTAGCGLVHEAVAFRVQP